jgi:hypothetical protein
MPRVAVALKASQEYHERDPGRALQKELGKMGQPFKLDIVGGKKQQEYPG